MFLMSERLLCSCDGFCEASEQEAFVDSDSSIILEFIALRLEAHGDGPFVS